MARLFTIALMVVVGACKVPNSSVTREAECGNNVIDPGEACDDGNNADGDGCSADCMSDETCGNDILDLGETCDDGNRRGGDGCSADCLSDETCGNGVVDLVNGETCDDANNIAGDGCSKNCQSNESCGNNVVDPGEQCDSGNKFTPTCDPDCKKPVCGDGVRNAAAGEECDDHNTINGDGCDSACHNEICGN